MSFGIEDQRRPASVSLSKVTDTVRKYLRQMIGVWRHIDLSVGAIVKSDVDGFQVTLENISRKRATGSVPGTLKGWEMLQACTSA